MNQHNDVEQRLREKLTSAAADAQAPADLLTRAQSRERQYRVRRKNRVLVSVSAVAVLALVSVVVIVSSRQTTPLATAQSSAPVEPALNAEEVIGVDGPWRPLSVTKDQGVWLVCRPEVTNPPWKPVSSGGWHQDGCDGSGVVAGAWPNESLFSGAKWRFAVGGLSVPARCEIRLQVPDVKPARSMATVQVSVEEDDQRRTAVNTAFDQARYRARWVQVTSSFTVYTNTAAVEVTLGIQQSPQHQEVAAGPIGLKCRTR